MQRGRYWSRTPLVGFGRNCRCKVVDRHRLYHKIHACRANRRCPCTVSTIIHATQKSTAIKQQSKRDSETDRVKDRKTERQREKQETHRWWWTRSDRHVDLARDSTIAQLTVASEETNACIVTRRAQRIFAERIFCEFAEGNFRTVERAGYDIADAAVLARVVPTTVVGQGAAGVAAHGACLNSSCASCVHRPRCFAIVFLVVIAVVFTLLGCQPGARAVWETVRSPIRVVLALQDVCMRVTATGVLKYQLHTHTDLPGTAGFRRCGPGCLRWRSSSYKSPLGRCSRKS